MPYIKSEDRKLIDDEIDDLVGQLMSFNENEIEGILNYVITQIINKTMLSYGKWRYYKINRVMGILECVKQEFYRRLAGPYENKAIEKNGDLRYYES